jgi:hypothetical protein
MQRYVLYLAAWLNFVSFAVLPTRADDETVFYFKAFFVESYEKTPAATARRHWDLRLVDDELCFVSVLAGNTPPPNAPMFKNRRPSILCPEFVKDGAHWRANLRERGSEMPKHLMAKNGWYVTGDYSSDPARVILTKLPTKYSSWRFVVTGGGTDGYNSWIKNDNDLGRDTWLSIEEKGVLYTGGWEVRRPLLSSARNTLFWLQDAHSGK